MGYVLALMHLVAASHPRHIWVAAVRFCASAQHAISLAPLQPARSKSTKVEVVQSRIGVHRRRRNPYGPGRPQWSVGLCPTLSAQGLTNTVPVMRAPSDGEALGGAVAAEELRT